MKGGVEIKVYITSPTGQLARCIKELCRKESIGPKESLFSH